MSQLSKFSGAGLVLWTALVAAAWPQQPTPPAISSPLEASQSFIETALAAAKEAVANGRYEESLRHAEDATNSARRLGDDGLLADSLGQQGVAYLLLARYPEATKVLSESLSYSQSVEIDQRLNDLTNLGVAYHYMGA